MVHQSQKITLSRLESQLWEAANILRGPVDAADFKSYIIPLLFFKRISDVYKEEWERAREESGGDEEYARFAENHRFQIPLGCSWDSVRTRSSDIGRALQFAFRDIEKENPDTLYGIFGDAQWTNKERLSDALLRDLIEHFSQLYLANGNISTDILGQAYEYLIKQFADATNKKAGEFYTPRSIVALMINILNPQEGETIYDPACGTGGMLLEAINHVRESGGQVNTLFGRLYGQEKNLTTSSVARINLLLHGIEDFNIVRGDTLRQPAFYHPSGGLQQFDIVIANPPFSLQNWGDDVWLNDPYGRNFAGMPPSKNGDFAWVQHMIRCMHPETGRMAVVLPHGVLFRGGKEGDIRRKLLEMDLLDTVIGLGPNLFYGTGLAACILIFRANKPEYRREKVLFIDASELYRSGRNQNTLEPEHSDQILAWYQGYGEVEGKTYVATLNEIADNDWNLNIPRYVEPIIEEETITVEEAIDDLKMALGDAYQAEEHLKHLLRQSGLME